MNVVKGLKTFGIASAAILWVVFWILAPVALAIHEIVPLYVVLPLMAVMVFAVPIGVIAARDKA